MKRLIILSTLLVLGLAFMSTFAQDDGYDYGNDNGYDNGGNVSAVFYNSLSPYGTWIQLDNGLTVWRPVHLRSGWAPYRYGRWVWTDDGWYWNSYDPFGYIVFHYGRWYFDNYYGWIWVPDNQWAPAWVQWRYDNDYIGWAPLPPYASFSIGFGISFTNNYVTPYSYWHFIGYRNFCDSHPYDYFVPDRIKYRVYSNTRFRTNYGYSDGRVINRGVDVDYIRQRSGGRIVESRIERVNNARDINAEGGRNSSIVRAFVPTREELTRSGVRNMEIRRGVRSSTLDASRIQLDRGGASRNDNPWQLKDNRPDNRILNPRQPENVRPDNRIPNSRQPENVRPENRNQNPWNPQYVRPENRNQNPPRSETNRQENRSSNPWNARNYAPQNRNRSPQPREGWQQRRENSNQGRGNAKKENRGRER